MTPSRRLLLVLIAGLGLCGYRVTSHGVALAAEKASGESEKEDKDDDDDNEHEHEGDNDDDDDDDDDEQEDDDDDDKGEKEDKAEGKKEEARAGDLRIFLGASISDRTISIRTLA
jgi:hypothetical protein